jgi:hypothetical protein
MRIHGLRGTTFGTDKEIGKNPSPDLASMMPEQSSATFWSSFDVPSDSLPHGHAKQPTTYDSECVAPTDSRKIIGMPRRALLDSEKD